MSLSFILSSIYKNGVKTSESKFISDSLSKLDFINSKTDEILK